MRMPAREKRKKSPPRSITLSKKMLTIPLHSGFAFSNSLPSSSEELIPKNPKPRKILRLHHSSPFPSPPPSPIPSPPLMPPLDKVNQKYRAHFYPTVELPAILTSIYPLSERVVNLITDYAKSKSNLYAIIPELIDATIPLKESLEQESLENEPMQQEAKQLKPQQSGSNGTVKFVRFKNDSKKDRWFAIKQEREQAQKEENLDCFLTQSAPPGPRTAFQCYENNCRIASKIARHPRFMRIFGIVLKEKKHIEEDGDDEHLEADKFSPYLILECLEGENLYDLLKRKALSLNEQYRILEQFIEGLVFLFEKGILPNDAFPYNFILNKNKQLELQLKFIDFDLWSEMPAYSLDLAEQSYEIAVQLFKDFAYEATNQLDIHITVPPPAFTHDGENITDSLKHSLQKLLKWYTKLGIV